MHSKSHHVCTVCMLVCACVCGGMLGHRANSSRSSNKVNTSTSTSLFPQPPAVWDPAVCPANLLMTEKASPPHNCFPYLWVGGRGGSAAYSQRQTDTDIRMYTSCGTFCPDVSVMRSMFRFKGISSIYCRSFLFHKVDPNIFLYIQKAQFIFKSCYLLHSFSFVLCFYMTIWTRTIISVQMLWLEPLVD